jgi:uncharacterized protein YvpB
MSRNPPQRRRFPPGFIWPFSGLLLAVVAGLAVMILMSWRQTEQVRELQAEVTALQGEWQTMEVQLGAMQARATAMEDRLATLEANNQAQQPEDSSQEIDVVRASLAEIQAAMHVLQETVDDLMARVAALETTGDSEAQQASLAEARLTVARQRQSHNLSCESSAASMVAQYHGVPLSEADVLAALPLNDNPHLGFRGNVDVAPGGIEDYGVYAEPIMTILNSRGLQARLVAGGLDGIKAAIARGNPIIAWVTYNCQPSTPTTVTIGGQAVTLVPYQHAVVVTGYSVDGVWANDPWDAQEDFYTAVDFRRALGYLGDMAIEVAAP